MKVSDIGRMMNIVKAARAAGDNVTLLIRGDAGLGKSAGVKQWVKEQQTEDASFGYYDLRAALLEAPDLQGLPYLVKNDDGTSTMHYAKPLWMKNLGERGVLFMDELNRGKSDTANGFMQLLTERQVGGHKLSDGILLVAAVNPDSGAYDVSAMDTALADRVITVDVEYDHKAFLNYMEATNFHPLVQAYIKSDLWIYKKPDDIGTEGKFISPRTWDYLSQAMKAGADTDLEALHSLTEGMLGKGEGKAFYAFVTDQKPLLAEDFKKDKKGSLKRLDAFGNASTFRGDLVSTLVDSVSKAYEGNARGKKINDSLIREIMQRIPVEYAFLLLKNVTESQTSKDWLKDFKEADLEFWTKHVKERITANGVDLDTLYPDTIPQAAAGV